MKELTPLIGGKEPYLTFFRIKDGDADMQNYSDESGRIDYMNKFGIDIAAVNMNLGVFERIAEKDLMRMTRLANDTMAEFAENYPDRIIPVGFVPKLEGEYLDELDRSIKDLGMKGCVIFTNNFGKPLSSPEFAEFYAKMARFDLPLFLHPTTYNYTPWIADFQLHYIFGWPFDTSLALGHLVFAGILEKHPSLKIVSHHLGGMIPYFAERIRGFYDFYLEHPDVAGPTKFPYSDKMKQHPVEHFRRIYADTATSGSLIALKCGYDFFGREHVLFGTDFPFGPKGGEDWTELIMKNLKDLDISEEDKVMIWERNARKLFKLG